jgi:biotin carboxyl carrier protein
MSDQRAVRVRLAGVDPAGDVPVLRVGPAPEPLHMTNPTTGRGPFGGVVAPVPDGETPTDGAPVIAPLAVGRDAVGGPDPDGSVGGVGAGGGGGVPADGTVRAQRHPLVDDEPADVELRALGRGRHVLREGTTSTRVVLEGERSIAGGVRRREVLVDGFRFEVEVESEHIAGLRERASRGRAKSAHSGPLEVLAIIPGKVVAVSVADGDAVLAGQQLLVVEAMKMQNELRAPRDGTIERVGVAPGVNIEVGDLLVVIS